MKTFYWVQKESWTPFVKSIRKEFRSLIAYENIKKWIWYWQRSSIVMITNIYPTWRRAFWKGQLMFFSLQKNLEFSFSTKVVHLLIAQILNSKKKLLQIQQIKAIFRNRFLNLNLSRHSWQTNNYSKFLVQFLAGTEFILFYRNVF